MHSTLAATILFVGVLPAAADACWESAGERYGVPAQLLYAIGRVESSLNPQAVNRSHIKRTGTYDIGLMQINSSHLPRLSKFGISEADLYDPCVNIHVGAWLLADIVSRNGMSWESVGAYNAACTQLRGEACTRARSAYAWAVYRRLPTQEPKSAQRSAAAASRPQPAAKAAPATERAAASPSGNGVGTSAAHPILGVRVAP
jgi:hypothetical protein